MHGRHPAEYDILGAFWVTIQLSVLSAIGALVIGTVVAILRVSPVAVLRFLGTSYVNVFRNTPLTLLVVFSVLGLSFILGLTLSEDLTRNSSGGRWSCCPSTTRPSSARPCAAASTPSPWASRRRPARSGSPSPSR